MIWIAPIMAFLAIVGGSPNIENHILKTAEAYNLPANVIMGIAICESGLRPQALNPKDTDGTRSVGLFQFKDKTFRKMGGEDIWNWEEQTELAAQMMKKDMWLSWPECFKKTIKQINDANEKNSFPSQVSVQ